MVDDPNAFAIGRHRLDSGDLDMKGNVSDARAVAEDLVATFLVISEGGHP